MEWPTVGSPYGSALLPSVLQISTKNSAIDPATAIRNPAEEDFVLVLPVSPVAKQLRATPGCEVASSEGTGAHLRSSKRTTIGSNPIASNDERADSLKLQVLSSTLSIPVASARSITVLTSARPIP